MIKEDKVAMYSKYYQPSELLSLRSETGRLWLREDPKRVCRFCGGSAPAVTFKKKAHAIPQALGNRSLLSRNECDECNHFHGIGIENELAKWMNPLRALSGIRGANGIPKLKQEGQAGWSIETAQSGLLVKKCSTASVAQLDEATKTIHFNVPRETYTPVAVMKAFVKIGLTLIPFSELENFYELFAWIKNENHSESRFTRCPVFYTFRAGAILNDRLNACFLWRKANTTDVPYVNFILGCGNETYQISLPSKLDDVFGAGIPMPNFPVAAEDGDTMIKAFDLAGTLPLKGEIVEFDMKYQQLVRLQN